MEFELELDGTTRKVSLQRHPGETEAYDVRDASTGEARCLTVLRRDPRRLLLAVDGKVYSVRPLSRSAGRVAFLLNGERVAAGRAAHRGIGPVGSEVASVNELVISHFPAKVVRVLAAPGARARTGETLLVLEAMKMETNLEAPRDCTVVEVLVKEGEMVARGSKLARLDFT